MREVKLLKHLPWFVLLLLWAAGSTLWLLFVDEQQNHLRGSFQGQLVRLTDELLRSRLEGRLGSEHLPEGIQAFAVYDPRGVLVGSWGEKVPDQLDPSGALDVRGGQILSRSPEGWIEFVRVLQPLRPRMNLLGEAEPDDPRALPGPPGMGGGRRQGYLYLRTKDDPLQVRLVAWSVGSVAGVAAWAGFLAFVGVLWFRTRHFQATLTQHRELLQFAEASRTLSHELQNPLAAILLQTALLNRNSNGAPPPEVAIIEEEAHRMSALVARVRDFLKDPQGQPERIDLGELAASLAERFPIPLVITNEGTACFVRFDPHRLRSVVENLIKNAVESGADPRPEVKLSQPKAGWVRLEVLDSGTGFTAESLKQAVNPFYTTKTTGTGIGLSITDSFVEAAGGKLKLENRSEGGARVTIDLPEATEAKT